MAGVAIGGKELFKSARNRIKNWGHHEALWLENLRYLPQGAEGFDTGRFHGSIY
jgi:hypothetical protein